VGNTPETAFFGTLFDALAVIGPVSFCVALIILAALSQRIGAVTKRPPLYRWFYVCVGLLLFGIVFRLGGNVTGDAALLYTVPVVVALLLAVMVAWVYWGWLLNERGDTYH
jgi:hypothetical protein